MEEQLKEIVSLLEDIKLLLVILMSLIVGCSSSIWYIISQQTGDKKKGTRDKLSYSKFLKNQSQFPL